MSATFKVKNKKVDKKNNKILETLDSKHIEMVKELDSFQRKLPDLEKELETNQLKLKRIQENIKDNSFDLTSCSILDDNLYTERYTIEETISYLTKEIEKIKNNEYINDYFLKTGHLLYDYYDGSNTLGKEFQTKGEETTSSSDIDDDDLLEDILESDEEEDKIEDPVEEEDDESTSTKKTKVSNLKMANKKTKITDFIEKKDGFEKAELYDKYVKLIKNHTFIQKDIFMKKSQVGQSAICPKCNITLTLVQSEGLQVCNQCGRTEYILIDSEKPSFREPPPEVSYFAYKRINHFNEWLSQFQAKESTEIPSEIYQLILLEMKKERINDLNKITHAKIREYLKKLKLNKYYEHIPHILNKLNKKVPLISKEIEEKLRHMFKEIQAPFMKICPSNRKNFLSYSYVLHKFVELLGLDNLKEGFHLLKSREKLHQQDQMWKEICKELNWMFIKSI
jgi:hypothetical protein